MQLRNPTKRRKKFSPQFFHKSCIIVKLIDPCLSSTLFKLFSKNTLLDTKLLLLECFTNDHTIQKVERILPKTTPNLTVSFALDQCSSISAPLGRQFFHAQICYIHLSNSLILPPKSPCTQHRSMIFTSDLSSSSLKISNPNFMVMYEYKGQ